MKKSLVAIVLVLVVGVAAQATPLGMSAPSGQAAQPGQTTQAPTAPKKEIKDSAEYNAYTSALNAPDPQSKIQGFENFVRQFPNSAFKEDALEQLMTAYQQSNNLQKTIETGKAILQVNPGNIRALALLAYFARASAEAGQNQQQNIADARTFGEQGLKAVQTMAKPEGVSDADFQKLKTQTTIIFNGAAGFAAMQTKDYATAAKFLQAAVELEPPTPESLHNVYPLAVADLEQNPMNPTGLWYVARAAAYSKANPAGFTAITKYGRAKYIKFHGGDDGWDQLLAQATAAASNAVPQGFAVPPAPSPAEQAAKLASTVDPKKMDFGQWELVLTAGDPATQEKVWSQIKGFGVPFAAVVIESTKTKLSLAATSDAIEQKRADVTVTMTGPIPATMMSKIAVGKEVQVIAKPDSYTPKPFMMQMVEGQLIAKKEPPKPAPKKGTTSRRRPAN
ncbi:MAG: hypothetical protein LAN37_09940 [Acidobacteriia bacterium]|nr:hypothetical protein [Terriglobia bacterium]